MLGDADETDPTYTVKTAGAQAHDTALYRPLLLRAGAVTKRFGAVVALDSINFEVPRHSIISLIGPNGSGKTVFFNVLTGISRADSGHIWYNGRDIEHLPPDQISALGIARTFQNIRLFGSMTVLENVLVGRHAHLRQSIWSTVLRTRAVVEEEEMAVSQAADLLNYVGLLHVAGEIARNLPYGAQRRLEIARALATDPQLLLLDEPTAGMNPRETSDIMRLIAGLRREIGLTILLVEHDMRVVMNISDRVTVLDYGHLIAEGTPEHVRTHPRVAEAYLGRTANGQ